jgi:hypothetical protein
MALSHVKNDTIADKTGTVTVWDGGGTTTIVATDLVRPSDWNSAHNQYYTLSGNTSLSSTASGSNVVLAASGAGITLIGSSDSIVISSPGYISIFEWPPVCPITTQTMSLSTSAVAPFQLPEPISASFMRFPVSFTGTSSAPITIAGPANASNQVTQTFNAVIYSFGVGASSKSLMSVASGSASILYRGSISIIGTTGSQYSTTGQLTYYVEGGSSSTSTSSAFSAGLFNFSTSWLSNFSALRYLDVPLTTTLAAGPYWLVFGYSSASATNSTAFSFMTNAWAPKYNNHFVQSQHGGTQQYAAMGDTVSSFPYGGIGSFSTAGGGTTSAFHASLISSNATNQRLYFQMIRWA